MKKVYNQPIGIYIRGDQVNTSANFMNRRGVFSDLHRQVQSSRGLTTWTVCYFIFMFIFAAQF